MRDEKQVTLSVVTVVKDDDQGLLITAKSILSQNLHHFEWIIVDSSLDHTNSSVLKDLLGISWIKILYQPPSGIYAAMNYASENAKGEWVWFINAGDFLLSQSALTDCQRLILENSEVDILGTGVLQVTPLGYLYSYTTPYLEKVGSYTIAHLHHQGSLIKRSSLLSHGKFDLNLRFAADSKLIDSISSGNNIKLISRAFVGFKLGGLSGLNFSHTLREIATYRPQSISFINKNILKTKNFIRFRIIKTECWWLTRIYLKAREKRILHLVVLFEIAKIPSPATSRRFGGLFLGHVSSLREGHEE
jgi:glycosyltransferase involved in cell wall biosynthesis